MTKLLCCARFTILNATGIRTPTLQYSTALLFSPDMLCQEFQRALVGEPAGFAVKPIGAAWIVEAMVGARINVYWNVGLELVK